MPAQLAEITDAYLSSVGLSEDRREEFAAFYEECIKSALLTAVITCDRVVRGVCVCEKLPIPEGCEVCGIYIAEGYKSRGLGRKLLFFALREMRAAGFKTAFLWAEEGDADAEGFVKKIGFMHDGKCRRNAMGKFERRYRIDI